MLIGRPIPKPQMAKFIFVHDQKVPDNFWASNSRGLCCWHDTEPFQGPVFSLPVSRQGLRWTVRGVFCSLHCAKRFLVDDSAFTNTSLFTLFSVMCKSVYGIEENVIPAPQRTLLAKFAVEGGISLTEFRGKTKVLTKIVVPPIFPFEMQPVIVSSQTEETAKKTTRYKPVPTATSQNLHYRPSKEPKADDSKGVVEDDEEDIVEEEDEEAEEEEEEEL
jgi:hypothetical protein